MVVSRRRVGVFGADAEGELYLNRRRRVGVEGGPMLEVEAVGCRTGDAGLCGDGGVTSVCRTVVKRVLACSNR